MLCYAMLPCQEQHAEPRPGLTQAEEEAKIEENRLRLLVQQYWEVVDNGQEPLHVSQDRAMWGIK